MTWAINVPGVKNLTQGQVDAVIDTAKELGMDPDWLFTVISFETGGTFSPTIRNAAGSGAFGLIQFMPSTAQNLLRTGSKEEAVAKGLAMTFNEQLKKMVIPYFKGGTYRNLEDVYLKVFYPAAMGKANDYVIGTAPSKVYTQNKAFDKAAKGYITRGDVTAKIRSVYNNATGITEITAPDAPSPKGGVGQFLVGILLALGLTYSTYTRTDLLQGAFKIRKTPRPLPEKIKSKLPGPIRRVV